MFSSIFKFESKFWVKKPVTWLYFLVFFGLALIVMAGSGGFFDPPTNSSATSKFINSPFEVNFIILYFCKALLFLLPAIIGNGIYKDVKNDVHSVLYSFPISKPGYLLGKFLSSFLIVTLISLAVVLGLFLGESVPGLDPNKIGPVNFSGYLHAFAYFILPNLFTVGAIVFATVLLTRNIYAGFISVLLMICLQMTMMVMVGKVF